MKEKKEFTVELHYDTERTRWGVADEELADAVARACSQVGAQATAGAIPMASACIVLPFELPEEKFFTEVQP